MKGKQSDHFRSIIAVILIVLVSTQVFAYSFFGEQGFSFDGEKFRGTHYYFQTSYFRNPIPGNEDFHLEKDLLFEIIKNENSNNQDKFTIALVDQVMHFSQCLRMDPFLNFALLKKESTFYFDEISDTFAVGLTQLTTAPIEEIQDQLGKRGPHFFIEENKLLVEGAILECFKGDEKKQQEFISFIRDYPAMDVKKKLNRWVHDKYDGRTDHHGVKLTFARKKERMKYFLLIGFLYFKILLSTYETIEEGIKEYFSDNSKGSEGIDEYLDLVLEYGFDFHRRFHHSSKDLFPEIQIDTTFINQIKLERSSLKEK